MESREQPLPSCVEVPAWRVAGKEATVHDPAHLACRQVENADPRPIRRRAEGREDSPNRSPGSASPGHQWPSSPALLSRSSGAEFPPSADIRKSPSSHLGGNDRAVLEPRGSADALLVRKPERTSAFGGDLHDQAPGDETNPATVGEKNVESPPSHTGIATASRPARSLRNRCCLPFIVPENTRLRPSGANVRIPFAPLRSS